MCKEYKRLSDLEVNESGIISKVFYNGDLGRRLMDLGFITGSRICCVGKSPKGNPKAYLVKGTVIAIRNEACEYILLERVDVSETD